jgi:hypothetical protein
MKVLNNDKNETIYFYCNNEIKQIQNNVQILNVEKCNGTFYMLGNNNLIYFYLPLTAANSYKVIDKEDNFELAGIYQFFFLPKKNEFNSINILLTIEAQNPTEYAYLNYYIDYGIIPYSRNIGKRKIIFKNQANLVIPNYANLSKDDEKYFIYFRFNTTLSKLSAKIIYENIIYLDDQTYIILKPGINNIKFIRNIDHYLNITKFNKDKIKHITSCNILDEGINLQNCKVGIYASLNSSERMVKQKLGRLLRHKKPIIIIPYYKNTRDEELVKKMLEDYNKDLVYTVSNITDIKIT